MKYYPGTPNLDDFDMILFSIIHKIQNSWELFQEKTIKDLVYLWEQSLG